MTNINKRLRLPQHKTGEPEWLWGYNFRIHNDWLNNSREELDELLAGPDLMQVIIECAEASSFETYSRFEVKSSIGNPLTIRDFLIRLTAYLHTDTEYWPCETKGLTVQNLQATAYTSSEVENYFRDHSNLPFEDDNPAPENYLDVISALDVSPAFPCQDYRLPGRAPGRRVYQKLLGGRSIFNGLEPFDSREGVFFLHLRCSEKKTKTSEDSIREIRQQIKILRRLQGRDETDEEKIHKRLHGLKI